jgi:uncharacterized alkaline shock family protein YloU
MRRDQLLKTYGLVGSSGTGKSYRAVGLASERGIPCIIDDGLLIMGNKILAGTSAKREATKLSAIRRALFMEPVHAARVMDAMRIVSPSSILILGTSVQMIERIAQRLQLPPPEEFIRIEDIASLREIRMAQRHRKEEGKHIIPVPTFEVRKDFSGYFIDPLRIFRIRGKGRQVETLEKTVVRPTYSYLGRYYISDLAIESVVLYSAQSIEGVHRAQRCEIISRVDGISIHIDVAVYYGSIINKILEQIQQRVQQDISYITGLNPLDINVAAKRLVVRKEASKATKGSTELTESK